MHRDLVRDAAEYLDGVCHDWAARVDIETLNIDSMTLCVLGQVFGDDVIHQYGKMCRDRPEVEAAFIFPSTLPFWVEEIAGRLNDAVS